MMTRLTRLIATAAGAVLVASSALAADLPPLAKKDRYKVGFAQMERTIRGVSQRQSPFTTPPTIADGI